MSDESELDTLHAFFLTIREDKHTLSRKGIKQTLAALTELEGLRRRVAGLEGERTCWKNRYEAEVKSRGTLQAQLDRANARNEELEGAAEILAKSEARYGPLRRDFDRAMGAANILLSVESESDRATKPRASMPKGLQRPSIMDTSLYDVAEADDVDLDMYELLAYAQALEEQAKPRPMSEAPRVDMPAGANTKDAVPRDGKRYRVFFLSHVVRWERGPNVWNIEGEPWDGEYHAENTDGWLPEPDTCWLCDDKRTLHSPNGSYQCTECQPLPATSTPHEDKS